MTTRGDLAFVGRSDELDVLVDVVGRDSADVVLVSGESGLGKSRLVREALAHTDLTVLVGAGSPTSYGRPFDVFRSAIEPAVGWWTTIPDDLVGSAETLASILGPTAPRLSGLDPTSPDALAGDPIAAGVALVAHLEPDVIVIEDLHWADVESLQILERVLTAPDRPTVVATYRPEDLPPGHPAIELLRHIERRQPARIRLEPLSADEIGAMVTAAIGDEPDDRLVETLLARTGGNPLYLEEFLIANRGDPRSLLESAIPWNLSEAIGHRLSELSDDERSVLSMAAVLGSSADYEVLRSASGFDDDVLIGRLRLLVGRGLLEERAVDRFHFRHELVREAILESLLGREKRYLHSRAFEATNELCPADHASIARHAIKAARIDDVEQLAPAGIRDYLESGSPFQALLVAEEALDAFPDHPELLELAARAAWLLGRLGTARRHAERWRRIEARTGSVRLPEALALVGRIAFEAADFDAEREAFEELRVGTDDDAPVEQRARALVAVSQHHMLHHEADLAIEYADCAIELADTIGDDDIRRLAMVERASTLVKRDPNAAGMLRELADQSAAVGDHLTAARALFNLSACQQPDAAEVTLVEMRRAAIRSGSDVMAVHSFAERRAELAIARGDLAAAITAVRRSRVLGGDSRWIDALTGLDALLTAETGDLDEARCLLAADRNEPEQRPRDPWLRAVEATLGEPDLDVLADALTEMVKVRQANELFLLTFRTLLRNGVGPATLQQLAKDLADGSAGGDAVIAVLAERADDPDAVTKLDAAIARLADQSTTEGVPIDLSPPLRAEVWISLARAQRRNGDTEASRQSAGEALALLEHWPGERRDEAAQLAAKGRSAPSDGALTGREHDVASLVAKGMTNGEIADALFISRKTVSTHVSHILAKLGLSTRTQIARWFLEQ
ncbi:MAG: LuxR C-terminal-related transcriptional regulator [Actinomycetota bacterium]